MCGCHGHSCCCSSGSCGCQSKTCSCGCHQSQCSCQKSCGSGGQGKCECKSCKCGGHAAKFLELADHAWMELLKEKIKEHIQSQSKNIDELARLIAEANGERWQKKMEAGQCCGSFEEKLNSFFGQCCQVSKNKGASSQGQEGSGSHKNK